MKFLKRFRKRGDASAAPEEPRLLGHDEPYYSLGAREIFVDVLTEGSAVRRARPAQRQASAVRELDRVIEKASLFCNGELTARMQAFREAEVDLAKGVGSEEEADEIREHFIRGCRLALGTND